MNAVGVGESALASSRNAVSVSIGFPILFIYWNDGSPVLQQMPEAQDGSLLVLDVMCCGHRNARITQHLARGRQPIARVDLASGACGAETLK